MIGFDALNFARKNWRILAAIAALLTLILAFYGWSAHERGIGASRIKAEDAKAVAAAQALNAAAIQQSDLQRPKDQATTDALQKDLTHAADQSPDSRPSAARVALACARLRQQAGGRAKLPEQCRLVGSAQAAPRP